MRIAPLSLFVMASLIATPMGIAIADPAPISQSTPTTQHAPAATSDADLYAAREVKDTAVTKFHGGSDVLIIGGGGLTLLVVVLLVLILI